MENETPRVETALEDTASTTIEVSLDPAQAEDLRTAGRLTGARPADLLLAAWDHTRETALHHLRVGAGELPHDGGETLAAVGARAEAFAAQV